nr:anti-sigma factor domain-containing protein [Clostridia bacterium]
MNGIIVEINRKDAVLLTDDGLFLKIKNRDYAVGQSVSITKTISRASKLITVAASMAAVISICTIGGAAYFTPTDYVSLDVNPSIEYTVNRFDRILDVKAVNDDGTEILSELDLDNMELENAVKKTIDQLIADGYLTNDENGGVVITTSNKEIGKAEELAAELEEELQIYIDDKKEVVADVEAEAVGLDRVREAKQLGVTPGKLNLVDKLRASTDSAIDEEKWLDMPVREINKAIKHNNEVAKDQMKESFEDMEENNLDDWTDQDDSLDKTWKQNE